MREEYQDKRLKDLRGWNPTMAEVEKESMKQRC